MSTKISKTLGTAVFVVFLIVAPLLMGDYYLSSMTLAMIFLFPALGLNLILGYTGMLSLGQGVFFGLGAYVSALMSLHFGTPFLLNLVVAGLVSGLVALPLGVPALRLRDTSFVMCTLSLVVVGEMISKNWISVTRGDMGLSGIPRPSLGLSGIAAQTTDYYYLVLVVAALALIGFVALIRSPAGRCMVAIRDNETLAESLGVPTWTYKLAVFCLSAVFAGLGGSLYAAFSTVVSPLVFQSYYSNTILIICLGGGVGRIWGPVIGSFVFVALSEALRITPELRMLLFGFALLLLVFRFPQGLAPLLDDVTHARAVLGWFRRSKTTGGDHARR